MTSHVIACPIWGDSHRAEVVYVDQTRMLLVGDSPRTGGKYAVSEALVNGEIKRITDPQRARLTTWLVDQRVQGVEQPEITATVVEKVKAKRPLPVHERAERLLRFIADQIETVGAVFDIRREHPAAYAWSESIRSDEISYFLEYLMKKNWLFSGDNVAIRGFGGRNLPVVFEVSVEGYSNIAEQAYNADSSQAFVAMWFDDSMNEVFEKGIEPAVIDSGYTPLRIDRKEHINKIDDEIIAELRRSRFLVADFTHGEDGARGGVYYEAGFAHGLDLPVIFTCQKDSLDTLHFDTEHYSHIVWFDPLDLRENLKNRILAVIGEGPGLFTPP